MNEILRTEQHQGSSKVSCGKIVELGVVSSQTSSTPSRETNGSLAAKELEPKD